MSTSNSQCITQLLGRAAQGDAAATNELIPLVYDELRNLASHYLQNEHHRNHTLQPTALAHEAYMRLVGDEEVVWENRAHFFAAASQAIRRILVDHARGRHSLKRGGDRARIDLDKLAVASPSHDADALLALDDTLARLGTFDQQKARVVELRYFGGLTVEQVAAVLGISERTVAREWRLARAWLRRELGGEDVVDGP